MNNTNQNPLLMKKITTTINQKSQTKLRHSTTHTHSQTSHTNSQSQNPNTPDKLSHTDKTNKLLTHKYEYLVGTTEALTLLVGNKTLFLKFVGCQKEEQAQDTKIYVENPFYLKGKTTVPTPNNSTIIKSITIVYSQVYT